MKRKMTIAGLALLLLGNTAFGQQYKNPALSAEERAADLCSRLTLEEKAALMQNGSPAIPRLAIPQFEWWSEALHGVGLNGKATVFPATIGMAASFNDSLLYQVYCAASDEARAKNNEARRSGEIKRFQGLSFWTPNINIFRDPRWGRGQETYGEDPYLTTRMGLAVVRGLQGYTFDGVRKDSCLKLLACAKHFAVHSGPEWNRHSFNLENVSSRDLWETYLPAFKSLVQEGDVREVMCAYQRIDGEPCCGNTRYLQQILRDEWGFKGLVVSDCSAISDFHAKGRHGVSDSEHQSAAMAVRAGTDVECGRNYRSLPEAVVAGEITEEEIDRSVRRLLKARFEVGDFDDASAVPFKNIQMSVVNRKEHKELALQMARESIVLLQNKKDILPLRTDLDVAVMGPNAVDSMMLWGNYYGRPFHTVTVLDGIRHFVPNARYIPGCTYTDQAVGQQTGIPYDGTQQKEVKTAEDARTTGMDVASIVGRAGDADVVIFVGGISSKLEGEEMKVKLPGFRGGDRTDIELPEAQRRVIAALHEAGKKVVFVNCSGSAMAMVPETEHADAIVQAWYAGEQGGLAIAETLFGSNNPSGKLPLTFYKNLSQLPDYEDYDMSNRTYRYFRGEPLYPFGYGLSYTTFQYKKGKAVCQKDGSVRLSFQLRNTGKRAGTEIAQVYIRRTEDVNGPIKTLRDFQRVTLRPGETQTVSFVIQPDQFETFDEATHTMRVMSGKYTLMYGGSSAEYSLKKINIDLK
ncbi:glycoside hydrolase family 3 C-terminal domain-containing protein [Bacteroides sp. AM16-24]|uniref:glycoside hydrolase family 3 C-terminal domain-containing protein n=1 Tax=Bacteroides sp. AM16-24 TaxID=2292002 RepID=UPI0018F49A44|nr:glycoside hydrolase family 3 C-terminal domain-containing protein [Bacteroides sp. AM16-24]